MEMFFKDNLKRPNDAAGNTELTQVTEPETCLATREFLDRIITIEDITVSLRKAKHGKATGQDRILNDHLKNSLSICGPFLVSLFNIILATGIVPSEWTIGIICPIFKKGGRSDPKHYRGITLLSCLGKLFTSVSNSRLSEFVETNNILPVEEY
jgi:hypothetical protein